MTFSEALEQYLDARDQVKAMERSGVYNVNDYENATAAQQEAADRMDELAPVR